MTSKIEVNHLNDKVSVIPDLEAIPAEHHDLMDKVNSTINEDNLEESWDSTDQESLIKESEDELPAEPPHDWLKCKDYDWLQCHKGVQFWLATVESDDKKKTDIVITSLLKGLMNNNLISFWVLCHDNKGRFLRLGPPPPYPNIPRNPMQGLMGLSIPLESSVFAQSAIEESIPAELLGAQPGDEPGASRNQSENHTTRH